MDADRRQPGTFPETLPNMVQVVERNIEALLARRQTELATQSLSDKVADRLWIPWNATSSKRYKNN